jgi:segregation and condensation protein B
MAASGQERLNLLRLSGIPGVLISAATGVSGERTEKMARVEAALLVADRPLSLRKLAQHATLADADDAHNQIDLLNEAYTQDASPFQIERVAAGYQLLTRPEFAAWLDKRHHRPARMKLSLPAMETLTIVAYRQPVTRADVEAIRGVQSGEMLKQLMDRHLVRITGEHDSLGRPYLYGTPRQFLEHFGLQNLDDLPDSADLKRPATGATANAPDEAEDVETAIDSAVLDEIAAESKADAAA